MRIAFDRPEVRNAFRPGTVDELYAANPGGVMDTFLIGAVLVIPAGADCG